MQSSRYAEQNQGVISGQVREGVLIIARFVKMPWECYAEVQREGSPGAFPDRVGLDVSTDPFLVQRSAEHNGSVPTRNGEASMTWETYLRQHQSQHQDDLLHFLRIPSISSLPEHAAAVQDAAQWVANRLNAADLEHVQVLPTGGHSVVYGDWLHAADKPTVLIYGHFDTQPVDPLHL